MDNVLSAAIGGIIGGAIVRVLWKVVEQSLQPRSEKDELIQLTCAAFTAVANEAEDADEVGIKAAVAAIAAIAEIEDELQGEEL